MPISALPLELLDDIFILTARTPSTSNRQHWCWLALTHVCRTWRACALACPLLWTHIDFTFGGEAWAEECLHRARAAPISVAQPTTSRYNYAFRNIFAGSARIRALYVTRANECVGALDVFLSQPTTALEVLHLATGNKPLENVTMYLPKNIFSGTAPRLRSLELHGFKFQWKTIASFTSLQRLVISAPSPRFRTSQTLIRPRDDADMHLPKWEDILPALRELSALRELRIEHCWPQPSKDSFGVCTEDQPYLRYEMRQLQTLSLAGLTAQCTRFLRYVGLPNCDRVDVLCLSSARLAKQHVDEIAPFLSARFAARDIQVRVALSSDSGLRIEAEDTRLYLQWSRVLALGVGLDEAHTLYERTLKKLGLESAARVDFKMEWEDDSEDIYGTMTAGYIF